MKSCNIRCFAGMGFVVFCFLLLPCISGCSPSFPDIVTEKPPEGYTFSSAEVRRIMLDNPFLLSGDYFLRRNPEKESTNLIKIFADAGEKARTQADTEKRLERLEKAILKEREIRKSLEPYRTKIGFLVDTQNISVIAGEKFLRIAKETTERNGAIYVDDRDIREVLSKTDCLKRRDLACITKIVGIYPGTRMLNLVEMLSLPDSVPGEATARVSIIDTGLAYRYPILEMKMPIKAADDVSSFLNLLASKVVDIAMEKKNLMPWYCHAFSEEEDERWFISAGAISGLKEGDLLNVVRSGKLIKTPTGLPAGWIPGDPKGVVRVERLVADDLAIVSLVSGIPPELEDFLIPQRTTSE